MKAIFNGAISFGLVNIPIRIYAATEARQIELHLFCNISNTPLKYIRWCPVCKKKIEWKDIRHGYKLSKDSWVILEKEELEKIKLPTTKTIDIQHFVDVSQIDPIYFEKTYYVAPEEPGIRPYALFTEALRVVNKAAVGKVVLRNKEHVVCLRPYHKGLAMHTLYYAYEIRDIDSLSELRSMAAVNKSELELAMALIDKLTEDVFDAAKYKDQYNDALKKLVKAKAEGKEFKVEEEKPAEETKSLSEALKISIENVRKKKKA